MDDVSSLVAITAAALFINSCHVERKDITDEVISIMSYTRRCFRCSNFVR